MKNMPLGAVILDVQGRPSTKGDLKFSEPFLYKKIRISLNTNFLEKLVILLIKFS